MVIKGNLDKLKKLEMGMHQEAASTGKSFGVWFEDYIQTPEGGGFEKTIYDGLSNFEVIQLRRKMHAAGEVIPPRAVELALEAQGVKAFGMHTDTVSKFYQNADTVVLFPWYLSDRIYSGAIVAGIWDKFIMETVIISGLDFRKIYMDDTEGDRQMGRSSRGGEFRKARFATSKQQVSLEKYGIELTFDYEVIYDTPLSLFAKSLEKVGKQIGVDETNDMLYTLVNGDGNSNGLESAQTKTTVTTNYIEKRDIITLAAACPMPYNLSVFCGPTPWMIHYWDALSDMTNPVGQKAEIGIPFPAGYRWDSGQTLSVTDRFYGVDKSTAMAYVTNDTMNLTETDRIINKQQTQTVISKRGVFTVHEQDGIGCLDITH